MTQAIDNWTLVKRLSTTKLNIHQAYVGNLDESQNVNHHAPCHLPSIKQVKLTCNKKRNATLQLNRTPSMPAYNTKRKRVTLITLMVSSTLINPLGRGLCMREEIKISKPSIHAVTHLPFWVNNLVFIIVLYIIHHSN